MTLRHGRQLVVQGAGFEANGSHTTSGRLYGDGEAVDGGPVSESHFAEAPPGTRATRATRATSASRPTHTRTL